MKYFIDTEFLEGTQNKNFLGMNVGKTKPTIDLISIGIVSEDNRAYYAISKDFNLKEAWNRFDWATDNSSINKNYKIGNLKRYKVYWIRENVLKPIFVELAEKDNNSYFDFCKYKHTSSPDILKSVANVDKFTYRNLKKLINKYGKTNKQIAEEIKEFVKKDYLYKNADTTTQWKDRGNPEFYAYYADYDWVAFCWLFGKMIDLPNGFPMYCIDLKQELERLNETLGYNCDAKGKSYRLQEKPNYPKQTNAHNALADARWNYELYKFLNTL